MGDIGFVCIGYDCADSVVSLYGNKVSRCDGDWADCADSLFAVLRCVTVLLDNGEEATLAVLEEIYGKAMSGEDLDICHREVLLG